MALIGGLIAACILIICLLAIANQQKKLALKRKLDKELKARESGNVEGEKSYAPWTQEQIINLNAYQMNKHFHPMTCPHRGGAKIHPEINGEQGRLQATPYGWVCPNCGYKQNWAHAFMTRKMVA